MIALAFVPFAFLAGLLRSRVAGAAAVSELVARLGAGRAAASCATRWPTRSATGRCSSPTGCRSGASGSTRRAPVPAAGPGSGRICTPVEHDGKPVAMLVHDPSVADERERVRAVGGAAALALENERLEAELRANVQELRASRARIVESADAARRRIERDLHDGAQQQLVALAIALRTARSRLERDPAAAGELLDEAAHDLDAAIRELRELARGIHPAVLTDRGLAAAVEALAQRIPLPVEIAATPSGRLPDPVEAAVYFVVAEALTNVARYARATHATVSVTRDGDRVVARSPTTASAAPTRRAAPGCAGSPTAWRRSTGAWRSRRRPARAPRCAR